MSKEVPQEVYGLKGGTEDFNAHEKEEKKKKHHKKEKKEEYREDPEE